MGNDKVWDRDSSANKWDQGGINQDNAYDRDYTGNVAGFSNGYNAGYGNQGYGQNQGYNNGYNNNAYGVQGLNNGYGAHQLGYNQPTGPAKYGQNAWGNKNQGYGYGGIGELEVGSELEYGSAEIENTYEAEFEGEIETVGELENTGEIEDNSDEKFAGLGWGTFGGIGYDPSDQHEVTGGQAIPESWGAAPASPFQD